MCSVNKYIKNFQDSFYGKGHYERLAMIEELDSFIRKSLLKNPKDVDSLMIWACAQFELGKSLDAFVPRLNDFLNENEKELDEEEKARIATNIAGFYNSDFDFDMEIKFLQIASRYNSHYPETYYGLAYYYFYKLEYNLAEEFFAKALEFTKNHLYFLNYIYALINNYKYEKALEVLEEALDLYPDISEFYQAKIIVKIRMDKLDEARILIEDLETRGYSDNVYISELYYEIKDYKKCIEKFDDYKAHKICISDSMFYFDALYRLGEIDKLDEVRDYIIELMQKDLEIISKEELDDNYLEEDRNDDMDYKKYEIAKFREEIEMIKHSLLAYKKDEIQLYPIEFCYIIDCLGHERFSQIN